MSNEGGSVLLITVAALRAVPQEALHRIHVARMEKESKRQTSLSVAVRLREMRYARVLARGTEASEKRKKREREL